MLHERRKGPANEMFGERPWGIEAAGRFSASAADEYRRPVTRRRRDVEIEYAFVDATEMFNAEVSVGDPAAPVPLTARRQCQQRIANKLVVERQRVGQRSVCRREQSSIERRDAQRAGPAAAVGQPRDRLQRFPEPVAR